MKRCPQCEFIYEDDQSLCDMDGVLLVFDSRTLPNLHALTTVPPTVQAKRNRAVPAFATLILALVLGMVYYVSTQRRAAQPAFAPPSAASTSNPEPEVNATPQPQPEPAAPVVEEAKPVTTKPAAAAPAPAPAKKPSTKGATSNPQTKPAETEKKEESKVGSILKKTGRLLKKPFKL
jgi:cytoskeletal protein RodZ